MLVSTTAQVAEHPPPLRLCRALAAVGTNSTSSMSMSCHATLGEVVAASGEDEASEKPLAVLEVPQKLECAAAGEKL